MNLNLKKKEQQHIELPKKEIKEVDPMEAWLKEKKTI
jgi:hypothetical protein